MRKVLIFAGSIRDGSHNQKLADAAMKVLAESGAETTMISLGDYPLPIVDQNLEKAKGVPENAVKLARMLASHDAVFIASPEYNSSIAPLLKNAIDWVSRIKEPGLASFRGITAALGSASPGGMGGVRGLYHLRSVLMNVGAQIISEQCAIGHAASAFGPDGMPSGEREVKMLRNCCRSLLEQSAPRHT